MLDRNTHTHNTSVKVGKRKKIGDVKQRVERTDQSTHGREGGPITLHKRDSTGGKCYSTLRYQQLPGEGGIVPDDVDFRLAWVKRRTTTAAQLPRNYARLLAL